MRAQHIQHTALRYFLEVVRCGSLGLAAQRLHVAGSAISRQIAWLEEALETPLFERRPRGMVPTAAGELLAAHARRSSLEAERTLEDIQALSGLRAGRVRLVATEGFAGEFLPAAITQFQTQHPGVRIWLTVAPPAQVAEAVRRGDADLGLTFSRAPEPDVAVVSRHPAPVRVLMRPDHALAQATSLTLGRLQGHAIGLLDAGSTLRQTFDIACTRLRLAIEPVFTTNHVGALLAFVQQGGGVTLASEISVRGVLQAGALRSVPLRDPVMGQRDIELQAMVGRTLPPAVQALLDHLRQRLREATR